MLIDRLKNILSLRDNSNLIFFVTSKCNQKCVNCFYSTSLNKVPDMTLEEIKEKFKALGQIDNILFSGGEPSLRYDLPEIVKHLEKHHGVKSITIPSNGQDFNSLSDIVWRIYTDTKVKMQLCVSLDGPEYQHDKLRGVKGSYDKAIRSIEALENFAGLYYDRVTFNINTVICDENIDCIDKIINEVEDLHLKAYTHSFEIVRAKPSEITPKELTYAYNQILEYKDTMFRRHNGFIASCLHYGNIYSLYKTQFGAFCYKKKWGYKCLAGRDNKVIYNNGVTANCELSKAHCPCTHLCYILLSMYRSKKFLFSWLPVRSLRRVFVKLGLMSWF